ncbi:maltose acetyltransferase domain-containing protein, partial [Levilactobacillus brevis]
MHTGDLYLPDDPAIEKDQQHYLDRLYDYNHTRPSDSAQKQA